MIILGHSYFDYPILYKVDKIDDINQTPSNAILYIHKIEKSITIIQFCQKNTIEFAIEIDTIKELIFANALNAKYIICKDNCKQYQELAENYLFDSKILAYIEDENEIEHLALNGIDGVIFKEAIA